jgi:transposase
MLWEKAGAGMAGSSRASTGAQSTLFPERLEDWVGEDHLVRVVDLFVKQLDLSELGFGRTSPARTGRPGYHPAVLFKLSDLTLRANRSVSSHTLIMSGRKGIR